MIKPHSSHKKGAHHTNTASEPSISDGTADLFTDASSAIGLAQRLGDARLSSSLHQDAAVRLGQITGNAAFTKLIQRDVRDQAREQHEKRGKQSSFASDQSTYASFNDAPLDDKGNVIAPTMVHDHGFLQGADGNIDESKRRSAGVSDYYELAKWRAKLVAAETLRPDLVDATAAYRHFLDGKGADRTIDYERFLQTDNNGKIVVESAISDATNAAIERHNTIRDATTPENLPAKSSFVLRTPPVGVGTDSRYPYPATENWQKAIGAHQIWIEAHVDVSVDKEAGTRTFDISMTIHMEDRYNFNPGNVDIATGTPDDANGRFEVTGLGQEYMNRGTADRVVTRVEPLNSMAVPANTPSVQGATPRTQGPPPDARGNPAAR